MAQRTLVRTYVAQFAVLSVVALLVLSAATYFASRRIAENEALREAETRAVAIAHNIASPWSRTRSAVATSAPPGTWVGC